MRRVTILGMILLCVSLTSFLGSQEMQSGSIRGRIVDDTGQPLPGVSILISGPALLGKVTAVTNQEGMFRAPFLTPGSDYEIRAELTGFETTTQKGIIINLGKTISIELQMKPSTITKEVTVVASTPTVDVVKSATAMTITSGTLTTLPLARNINMAFAVAAGTIGGSVYGQGGNVYGHGRGEVGFVMDGISANEPDVGGSAVGADTGMAWDMVDEIELISTGAPADTFSSIGGLVNIVTKSGGNSFSGEASLYYTNKDFVKVRLPDADLQSLGLAKPSTPVYDFDSAVSLGGPIIKDKIWFMGELRYAGKKLTGDFRPTVINGKQYNSYDRTFPNYIGFFKLSAQLAKNVRAFAMGHYSMQDVPYYYSGYGLTTEANKNNKPIRLNYSGTVSWALNSSTILDLRAGGLYFKWTGKNTKEADPNGPHFSDDYTGYSWGNTGATEYTYKPKLNVSLNLTRFQDNFLGGNHEFKVGIEFERNRGDWGFYMKKPLWWYYYDGNLYYYRGLYGIDHADPVDGDGLLEFAAMGDSEGSGAEIGITSRIGGFIQDSFTLKRLTINVGVRADHLTAWSPGRTKGAASDPLTMAIGATYFEPQFGINPYGEIKYDTWNNAFPYGTFISPRLGATYDVFGNGKTAIKASFVRQQESFSTATFSGMYPLTWRSYMFKWWDTNANGQPDLPGVDNYESFGDSPLPMVSKDYKNAIDPNVKISYEDEIAVAFEHELIKDFKVGVRYINKNRKKIMGSVLYDQGSQRYWYTYEKAPEWWVPFTTTIPAYKDFPAQTVTMYFQSNDAPDQNYRLTNIPEGKMKFYTYEVTFEKRMTNGWQVGGSFSYTKMTGNYPVTRAPWASQYVFSNPNTFVNNNGDLPFSRPIMVKLYGTFRMPYNFLFSFFFQHIDGSPWGRTVGVNPPADWAAANNARTWAYSIYVEEPGSRWNQASESLDVRIEKDLKVGPGTLGFYADIFNLLNSYTVNVSNNPGGTWRPADANTAEGTFTPGRLGLNSISGSRIFKFSVFYRF